MRQKSMRYGAAGVVALVLVIGLVFMANWLGARHYKRWDWTSSKLYTLSEKSLDLVRGLETEVRIVVFMVPSSPLFGQAQELLERYAAASDEIVLSTIDPEREPLKTKALAEQFGITMADTVVFIAGDRTKYVTSEQMVEYDYSGMQYGQQPTVKAFRGEEEFTSAIQSLVISSVPKIYFVTGHGEATPTVQGNGALAGRSLSILMDKMKKDNMVGEEVSLLSGVIPDDADVIAIIGPTRPYTEAEIAALDGFLDSGGRALVALDPLIEADGTMRQTRLEAFLAGRGVMVNDDLVVDPSRKLPFFDLSAVYLTDFADHPVTTGLDGIAVLFTVTRSLIIDSDDARILVETSAEGWGETDLGMLLRGEAVVFDGGLDTEGPVAAAVVVESGTQAENVGDGLTGDSEINARLAVFGDSDFLTDVDIGNAGNEILAMNTLNWLAARDHSMGIPPHDMESMSLYIDQQKMRIILVVVLLVMPGAAIAMGIMVWRRRKH
jgi:gliding motility-associatede transport system auxiliary component